HRVHRTDHRCYRAGGRPDAPRRRGSAHGGRPGDCVADVRTLSTKGGLMVLATRSLRFARTRRTRRTEALRSLVRETRLDPSQFIYPIFVKHGTGVREE